MLLMNKIKLLIFSLLFVSVSVCWSQDIYQLTAEQWAVPRSVDTLLTMQPLISVMKQLRNSQHAKLTIRYPGGDEGTLWAHELRAWLISLGLPSYQIELIPGSTNGEVLYLEVLKPNTDESFLPHLDIKNNQFVVYGKVP